MALEHAGGALGVEDLRGAVERGDMQLWPGRNSLLITELVNTPRTKELNFVIAAGEPHTALSEIQAMYPHVLEWGKAMGCTRATFLGRQGWGRTFLTREDGWRPGGVLFVKEL